MFARHGWRVLCAGALLMAACGEEPTAPAMDDDAVVLLPAFSTIDSDESVVFGPRRFHRGRGRPRIRTVRFSVPDLGDYEQPFRLIVTNGPDGTRRVSSARIWLNGESVVGPRAFSRRVAGIEREVELRAENVMKVRVASAPGSALEISLVGTKLPPTPIVHLFEPFDDGDYTNDPAWSVDLPGIGTPFLEVADGAFHFRRTNAGGSGWWIYLVLDQLNIPVGAQTEVGFDGKVVSSSVPNGCGVSCSEWAVEVRVLVEEADGNEVEIVYALNDDGGQSKRFYRPDGSLVAVFVGRGDAPTGVWVRDLLFRVQEEVPGATRITRVRAGGSGWDFEGWLDNILIREAP